MPPENTLSNHLKPAVKLVEEAVERYRPSPKAEEAGVVTYVGRGIARVTGLPDVQAEELIEFPEGLQGLVLSLDEDEVGCVLLGPAGTLSAGDNVRRSHRVADVPVGQALLGRVVDSTARPLDGGPPVATTQRSELERPAPPIMARAPVKEPLQTGLKVVDAVVPIGRGQRELILGDRQTGKTAIALDAIINQRDKDVLCVYCAIGQRNSAVARVISELEEHGALDYTTVVVASGEDTAGLQYLAPYAATAMAEHFMAQGQDVLIVYDDLTQHAQAYRELSLLLRRPPGREAYPGDIFYVHSRLLERATHLREEHGGGSLTALPIVRTEAQNISAYIPTNLISITDGQIYLSPDLFEKGLMPAVDVGRSVSRVGGKAQLPAYKGIAGDLKLFYSQFEELETFSRFGTRLDEVTKQRLERGRKVREVLKQRQYHPMPVAEQVAVLLAVTEGVFDGLSGEEVAEAEARLTAMFRERCAGVAERIQNGEKLEEDDRRQILARAHEAAGKEKPASDEQPPDGGEGVGG